MLVAKISHHRNISILYLTQNLFDENKCTRTISLNAHYLVLFKNRRDAGQFAIFARQRYPICWKFAIEGYEDATSFLLFMKTYIHLASSQHEFAEQVSYMFSGLIRIVILYAFFGNNIRQKSAETSLVQLWPVYKMLRKVIRFPVMMINFVFVNRPIPVLSSYGKTSWKAHGKLYLSSVTENRHGKRHGIKNILNYGVQHMHVCDSFYLLVDRRPRTVIHASSTMRRHPHCHRGSMCY